MATQRVSDEADIRRRIDTLTNAIRAMDLEGVKSIYAPAMVSFDIVPPLQHAGAAASGKTGKTSLRHTSAPSATRFAASPSPRAMAWRSDTASIGSAAR